METVYGLDAYTPREIAQRVSDVGVAKTKLPLLSVVMLGMLAGAFIGLGALFNVIVLSDASIPMAARRVLGGMVFSLGLFLVLVAGAELFTGNNLLAMAWAERKVTTLAVLRNWLVVCAANFAGALALAVLVYLSGHPGNDDGAVARTYMRIAAAKTSLPPVRAFFSGVMCNVLVCMAVWVAMAGRSVTDKLVAIVLPIAAFVAAGFEHSIANMYLIPLGMMLQADAGQAVQVSGLARNLVPVIGGNLVGGSVLVALVYYVIYVRPRALRGEEAKR
ncbi:MAG TPA: formate/nitrite transporter family protein [Usitatibacter sp.]|nr:formate/nitrite transporter family protein [Usitatibacter sp.]